MKDRNLSEKGLSLFEYASIAAMQGLLSAGSGVMTEKSTSHDPADIAKSSCEYAQALLTELEGRAHG